MRHVIQHVNSGSWGDVSDAEFERLTPIYCEELCRHNGIVGANVYRGYIELELVDGIDDDGADWESLVSVGQERAFEKTLARIDEWMK